MELELRKVFRLCFVSVTRAGKRENVEVKNIRTRTSLQIDDKLLIDFSPDTYAHTLYGGCLLYTSRCV